MSEHIHLYKTRKPYKCVTAKGLPVLIFHHDIKTRTFIAKPDAKEPKRRLRDLFRKKPDNRKWYREDGREVNDDTSLRIVAIERGNLLKCVYEFAISHVERGGQAWTFTYPIKTFKIRHIFAKDVKRFTHEQEILYSEEYNLPPSPDRRKDLINKVPSDFHNLQWEVNLKEWESLR